MIPRQLQFGGYFPPFPLGAGSPHLDTVEAILGCPIGIVMWYQWWDVTWLMNRSAKNFQNQWLAAAGNREVLIKWEPWKPGRQIVQPRFALQTIIRGGHDHYIHHWAERVRDYGKVLFLCPMPELNGFWFHWSTAVGHHPPEEYVTAWRHIHQIFAEEGAANVRWVWSPNAGDMPEANRMEQYYPGRDVVDVLGLSVYNWGTARAWSQWRSFEEIFLPYYARLTALDDQPIWITEMACAPEGGDQKAWIQAMFAALPSFPRLKALIWFNVKKETDWRITENVALAQEFARG